jgi:glycosyltransferase involved in cell wall biosynthesis
MTAGSGLRPRVQRWVAPRIGTLRQHAPRPLRLPASYFKPAPRSAAAPSIALVTPSYEQGHFLERTIQSVLMQSYPALEYVVQDGGSSDESMAVIRSYQGSLLAWSSEPDGGQADAINRGFARTSGEIMGWLNSDDLLLPGALAFVAAYFEQRPDVDVLYGNRVLIDEQDRQIGLWILPRHDVGVLGVTDYVPQETLFWRRSVWNAVGAAVDPTFEFALDWDLLLRFQAAGARFAHVSRFLGAFRVHQAQKSLAARDRGAQEMRRLRERALGRETFHDDSFGLLRSYLFRHRVLHARQCVVNCLPRRRWAVPLGAPRHPGGDQPGSGR